MDLTSHQKNAVLHMGSPALVVAGAGSGKTRTLTSKIVHLIENGHSPENILAITFTNKAADEMKSRLVDKTGLSVHRFPWVRTYHSACLQILKRNFEKVGFTTTPQIYQIYHQEKIVKSILLDLNYDKKHTKGVLYQISLAKNSADPSLYFNDNPRYYGIPLSVIYKKYEKELIDKNAVDFDNILFLTRNLLRENQTIRSEYQNLFSYVLVDEYQDTNNLQEELTSLFIKNGNLFCVGDDWQAIYSFRGSNINHFLSFRKNYSRAKIFRLEQNFRSADEIVQAANHIIKYNENRVDKMCFSQKKGGIIELHSFFDENEEANWVSGKIQLIKKMGYSYDQMAVLYRTKFCSLSFEKAFRMRAIPYQMMGGKGFFERKEILDLVSYLTVSQFEYDDVSFERIINIPKRGIGPSTIKKIYGLKSDGMSLLSATRKAISEKIISSKVYNELKSLIELIDDIKVMTPKEALTVVMDRINYREYIENYVKKNDQDMTTRNENIEQLVYSASKKERIIDFIEEISLVKEDKEDDDAEENSDGIKLSTIHASKGLEYKAVFVVGCEEQLFPHWKSMESPEEMEEERRLMYVSMTRAENLLFVSCAEYRKGQFNRKSRFFDELKDYIDVH